MKDDDDSGSRPCRPRPITFKWVDRLYPFWTIKVWLISAVAKDGRDEKGLRGPGGRMDPLHGCQD